jgi:ectoine hydroxylase-related dioxygenase (phytanoyl-CoA dioxygenase family)
MTRNSPDSAPARPVSQAEIEAYRQDGVVCLRAIFDSGWIDEMCAAFEVARTEHGPLAQVYTDATQAGEFFFDVDVWTRQPAFRDFAFNSPAAAIAAVLMASSRINLFYDQLFIKEPGKVAPTPWHQDLPYWRVEGSQICTVWLPLDPVSRDMGVEFVRGSHRSKVLYSPVTFSQDQTLYDGGLPPVPDIEERRGDYDIVGWDVQPGDCLVFQAMTLHGARGGESPRRRRVLASRWCGDDARYVLRRNKTNIPTSDPGLEPGDPIAGPLFPQIWPRAAE